ncbi:hypothetical protein G5I_08607 [Acromyrmex echinatior]|uniref:Uncharacterized protein n=1 Tax=Acromyrmex echinatior TaxID=103372 RepID=F4WS00_ACREC|nr:hypothetical protein G5I_08607 [Acromyrmex echinatior]
MNDNVLKMGGKSPSLDCEEEQKLISPTTPMTPIMQMTKNPYSSLKYRVRHQNPDKFQFKFSAILCLRQRLLLASEKA